MVTVQHGSEHVCVHKCEERQRKKKDVHKLNYHKLPLWQVS